MSAENFTKAQQEALWKGLRMLKIPCDAKPEPEKAKAVGYMTEQQVEDVFLVIGVSEKGTLIAEIFFDLIGEPEGSAGAVVRELAAIFLSQP